VEGFRYSPALREAGASGMVWDEETLAAYLADPRGFIRGNRMAFQGLRSDEDIAAVIAYMQATGAGMTWARHIARIASVGLACIGSATVPRPRATRNAAQVLYRPAPPAT
jgi:hypothetical protein